MTSQPYVAAAAAQPHVRAGNRFLDSLLPQEKQMATLAGVRSPLVVRVDVQAKSPFALPTVPVPRERFFF